VKLIRDVPAGQCLTWGDVAIDTSLNAVRLRKEMEALCRPSDYRN